MHRNHRMVAGAKMLAAFASLVLAAQCDAGGTNAARLFCSVKRIAC